MFDILDMRQSMSETVLYGESALKKLKNQSVIEDEY